MVTNNYIMTKKQKKEIARMWIASMAQNCGTDSFELDEDCSLEDADDICQECQNLAATLLRKRPFLETLPMIIGWVISGK